MGTLRAFHTKKLIHACKTVSLWTENKKHPTPAAHVTLSTIGKRRDGRWDELVLSSVSTQLSVFPNAFFSSRWDWCSPLRRDASV